MKSEVKESKLFDSTVYIKYNRDLFNFIILFLKASNYESLK